MNDLVLMINSLTGTSAQDELDVLVQADAVESAAKELGYMVRRVYFDMDLGRVTAIFDKQAPDLVFNLVESVGGKGALIHLCPSLLDAYCIRYTGSGTYALVTTTDKIKTKQILKEQEILTPQWIREESGKAPEKDRIYILKPIREDGSVKISDESLMEGKNIDLAGMWKAGYLRDSFFEEYIDGREFNLSVLAGQNGPEVMPAAEMLYVDYPDGKPKILNYASKWDSASFEYHKTIRTFDISAEDRMLLKEMVEISLRCWKIFDMNGYIRVDFRVDHQNRPWVLEVNANPCLSPDAGFVAACQKQGISYTAMIQRIITAVP